LGVKRSNQDNDDEEDEEAASAEDKDDGDYAGGAAKKQKKTAATVASAPAPASPALKKTKSGGTKVPLRANSYTNTTMPDPLVLPKTPEGCVKITSWNVSGLNSSLKKVCTSLSLSLSLSLLFFSLLFLWPTFRRGHR